MCALDKRIHDEFPVGLPGFSKVCQWSNTEDADEYRVVLLPMAASE